MVGLGLGSVHRLGNHGQTGCKRVRNMRIFLGWNVGTLDLKDCKSVVEGGAVLLLGFG